MFCERDKKCVLNKKSYVLLPLDQDNLRASIELWNLSYICKFYRWNVKVSICEQKLNRDWVLQQDNNLKHTKDGYSRRKLMFWNGQVKLMTLIQRKCFGRSSSCKEASQHAWVETLLLGGMGYNSSNLMCWADKQLPEMFSWSYCGKGGHSTPYS